MKNLFALSFLACFALVPRAQHLVSRTLIGSYTRLQVDSILDANGIPTTLFHGTYDINAYKIIYNTLDYDSTPALASGLLALPKNLDCALPLVSYAHGTTSVKEDVPSRLNGEGIVGLVSASSGVVMCEPDFFGMGDGDWPHYYLHAFTQAMCNIDLIRAVREACQQDSVALNGQLFLSGYSQGGFVTMATHQYMQTYFPNEFTVTKSLPGAGSYDMSGAMVDLMLSDAPYPSPGYLPFLIFTWNPIYHFFTDASEYLKPPYDTVLPPLVDGLHSIDDINAYMPDTPKLIFKQEQIDTFASNQNHPLRLALKDNDVYQWVPQAPMMLVHCLNDRQVPIQNTYNAYDYFIQHGAADIETRDPAPSLGHGDCGNLYFLVLKGYLDSVINASNPCLLSVEDGKAEALFEVFPNPTHAAVAVRWKNIIKPDEITLKDLAGKVIMTKRVSDFSGNSTASLDISEYPQGIYFLQCITPTGIHAFRVLKI